MKHHIAISILRQLLLLVVFTILMTASPARAEEVLRVAFSEHPPWKVLDENGEPDGIDIEMLRLLAARLDLKLEFVHFPFKRCLKMVEIGEIDVMTGVLHRPERDRLFHFIAPPYKTTSNKAFFALKGRKPHLKEHEDLYSLHIGTGLGAKYHPAFDNDPLIKKYPTTTPGLTIRMLLAGRIHAFIMTEATGEYRIAKQGLSDRIVKLDYGYRDPQSVHMVLSKASPHAERLPEFNQAMKELVEGGSLTRCKTRFYQSLAPQQNATDNQSLK